MSQSKKGETLGEYAVRFTATGEDRVVNALEQIRREIERSTKKTTKGIREISKETEETGEKTRGWLGRLRDSFTAVGVAAAGGVALAAGGLAGLAALAENEQASIGLRTMAAEWVSLLDTIKTVSLEAGEVLARALNLGPALGGLRESIYSMWENWRGTFLSAADLAYEFYLRVVDIFTAVGEAIGLTTQHGGDSWADMIRYWLDTATFFLRQWRSIFELAGTQLSLVFDDAAQIAAATLTNIAVVAQNIALGIYDVFNFLWQALRNIGLNIRNFMESLSRWMSGGGWQFDAVELDRGFRSSLMRDGWSFVSPEYASREERDRQAENLGQQLADFRLERELRQRELLTDLVRPQQQTTPTQQFGFVGFSELARRSQEDTLKQLAERQAGAAERAAVGIEALAEAARGPGLRVQGTGARYE